MKRCSALALLFLFLIGCSTEPASVTQTIRVGVSVYRQDDTFVSLLVQRMEEATTRLEQEYNVKISLEIVDAQFNQSIQSDQVASFLQKEYDIICVNIVDRTSAAMLIDKAQAENVPLIFFNREPVEEDLRRWKKAYYVGANAEESGRIQGELVADAYAADPQGMDRNGDGKLQYVMLEGDPGHQDSLIRTNMAIHTITDAGIALDKLATGIAYWQRMQATTKAALWIEKYGTQIELIIANNDDMALGALDAYEAADMAEHPAIVGIDGTPTGLEAVQRGNMLGTVYNDAREQANGIMGLVCALALNRSPDSIQYLDGQYIRVPYYRISPQNVENYLMTP